MLDYKKDAEATKARKFLCKRSYVTISGHQFLRGKDKELLAEQVYRDAKGICVTCRRWRDRSKVDLEHIEGGSKNRRCDCYFTLLADLSVHTNLQNMCSMLGDSPCHRQKHNREVQLRRIA